MSRGRLACAALVAAAACSSQKSPLGPSVNRAPVVRAITVSPGLVLLGGTARVVVDASDPDGDPLFFRYTAQAGTVVPDAGNPALALYTQDGSNETSDRITVTVVDPRDAAATASRAIRLQGNRPPTVRVTGGGSCHPVCQIEFDAVASDPDGDDLTYEWSGCADGSDSSATCRIGSLGEVAATVIVSDGRGGVTTASANAFGTNRPPTVGGGQDFNARQARFQVTEGDPDGDSITCGWQGDCSCTGSVQSHNLACTLPSGISSCFETYSCTDEWGGSASTTFHLFS